MGTGKILKQTHGRVALRTDSAREIARPKNGCAQDDPAKREEMIIPKRGVVQPREGSRASINSAADQTA